MDKQIRTILVPVTAAADGTTHLRIDVYYDLGGYNCFTYKSDARGYYASFRPVERHKTTYGFSESFTMFKGFKLKLREVARQSKKAETESLSDFMAELPEWLDTCEKRYNIKLNRDEIIMRPAA